MPDRTTEHTCYDGHRTPAAPREVLEAARQVYTDNEGLGTGYAFDASHTYAYAAGREQAAADAAEGRLPDEIEWGWRGYSDQDSHRGMPLRDEAAAREVVAQHPGTELVRRLVGPWLPVPTEETP